MTGNMVIVGCGGITFHALPGLAVLARRLEVQRVECVDHDQFEERNFARQPWHNGHEGQPRDKSLLCAARLGELCAIPVIGFSQRVIEPPPIGAFDLAQRLAGGGMLWVAPDNHECRRMCLEAAWRASRNGQGGQVLVVIGGCEREHGDAMSVWFPAMPMERIRELRPELWEPDDEPTNVGHCADHQEQTFLSNGATAHVMLRALDELASPTAMFGVRYGWQTAPDGDIQVEWSVLMAAELDEDVALDEQDRELTEQTGTISIAQTL